MSDLDKGQTGQQKTARNPVKIIPIVPLKKPDWIRVKAGNSQAFYEVKRKLRENNLHTVCEEASCPSIGECFGNGTATFMIMGTSARGAARSATWDTAGRFRSMAKNRSTSRAQSRS